MIISSVRKMVAELFNAFLVIIVVAKSQATWDIITHPVVLGENILLRCKLLNCTCNENSTSQWTGGPSYKLLGINDNSMNKSKYKMIRGNSLSSFYIDLLIYNVSYSDLNHDYTCSCGFCDFTKNLTVGKNDLLADENSLLLPVSIASSVIFLLIVACLICSRNRTRMSICSQCFHRKVYKTAKGLTRRNSDLNLSFLKVQEKQSSMI